MPNSKSDSSAHKFLLDRCTFDSVSFDDALLSGALGATQRTLDLIPQVARLTTRNFVIRVVPALNVINGFVHELVDTVVRFIRLQEKVSASDRYEVPIVTHLNVSFGARCEMLIPTRSMVMGCGSMVLSSGEVTVLLLLESLDEQSTEARRCRGIFVANLRIIIMYRAVSYNMVSKVERNVENSLSNL